MSREFPFIGTVRDAATVDLPLFQEYAWDFERDRFLYDANGGHILLTGNPALEVWIYKALKTERFEYLAYSWQYGIELKPFIGKVMGLQERYSELRRVITECLMVNPYIKSIDYVRIDDLRKDRLMIGVGITSVYGSFDETYPI